VGLKLNISLYGLIKNLIIRQNNLSILIIRVTGNIEKIRIGKNVYKSIDFKFMKKYN
jgi:hypothetical protein